MDKRDQGLNKPNKNHCRSDIRLRKVASDPLSAEKIGLDLWLSSSIDGKRREILKQQMSRQISRMKALQFDFFDFKV